MDTAEQVNDNRAGSGLTCGLVLAEQAVRQQNAQTGTGIGLEHVHDGAAGLCSLADANWVENTVVDGVVQEQHLCRFNKDGNQRQQAVADQKINACGKYGENGGHKRADNVVAEDRQQHAEDADGEIVDQHFKTGGNVLFHAVVKLLDDPACQRAHHHRTHQHGVVRAADAADNGDAGNDAAAFLCDHIAALTGDENGQQVAQHR